MRVASQHRDIIVLGASAGGIEALTAVASQLPPDFPAAVFVVQHLAAGFRSGLPELLTRHSALRALHPTHGQEIAHGLIYVAPPDMQLLVRRGYLHVTRGPKENGHRPAVDTLFRTAARAYGPTVIGVVLTGNLDCGTAGLLSIKARGGIAIAQDPDDAEARSMPESAIRHVQVDHVVRVAELGPLLVQLVKTTTDPSNLRVSRTISELEGDELGAPAEFTCPHCQGALTETSMGEFHHFRCHVGHAFSLDAVLSEQTDETERALWAAVRALEESASLALRMAERATGSLRERFLEKHETLARQVALVRGLLLGTDESAPVLNVERL
jgi:two-component system, chemotaxis family, protein-glutamate methylesterase/glutaminase